MLAANELGVNGMEQGQDLRLTIWDFRFAIG